MFKFYPQEILTIEEYSPLLEKLKIYLKFENNEEDKKEENISDEILETKNNEGIYTINCNQIFAKFLFIICRYISQECFSEICFFICLYRKCLNEVLKKKDSDPEDFCENNNGENIIEVCNEFILNYVVKYMKEENKFNIFGNFEKTLDHSIRLLQQFCEWLYINCYTNSKIELINNQDSNETNNN